MIIKIHLFLTSIRIARRPPLPEFPALLSGS